MKLLDQLESCIQTRGLVPPGGAALLAVSGGLDSMVLLELLTRLAPRHACRFEVGHFNHQLRGVESDQDEAFVRARALALGLRFHSGRGDVREMARQQGLSIEMAARQWRHEFLAREARGAGVETIFLGHHADDQVETFWLRLLRGSTGQGLAAMKWASPSPADPAIQLIRPFLAFRRRELEECARAEKISFREDASNQQEQHLRNKVRRQLLPRLESEYQPAIFETTQRQIEVLADEKEFLALAARHWLKEPVPPFAQLHPALQREVLHQQLLDSGLAPTFDLIEALRLDPGKPFCLSPERAVMRDAAGVLSVASLAAEEFRDESIQLEPDGPGELEWNGARLQWRSSSTRAAGQPGLEVFDAEKIGPRITLRFWRPGDRFQPIGSSGSAKLQDLFTNLKIPGEMRRQLLVAAAHDGQIFWVEQLRISERFKITPSTTKYLHWQFTRASPSAKAPPA